MTLVLRYVRKVCPKQFFNETLHLSWWVGNIISCGVSDEMAVTAP